MKEPNNLIKLLSNDEYNQRYAVFLLANVQLTQYYSSEFRYRVLREEYRSGFNGINANLPMKYKPSYKFNTLNLCLNFNH